MRWIILGSLLVVGCSVEQYELPLNAKSQPCKIFAYNQYIKEAIMWWDYPFEKMPENPGYVWVCAKGKEMYVDMHKAKKIEDMWAPNACVCTDEVLDIKPRFLE